MAYIDTLKEYIGRDIGTSDWILIDQAKIDAHAKTTGDGTWVHTDPVRAAAETPFGRTIAQEFLLVSHLTRMASALTLPMDGVAYPLNYGFDRLRMIQPVPVNSRVRGHFELQKVDSKGHHGILIGIDASMELEGDDIAPALVAEWLVYLRLTD
jgi:acyl dehydratase